MFNNRKYINQLTREIKNLKEENKKLKVVNKVRAYASDFWIEKYYGKNQENENLKKDIESKENTVCNVLDSNKELSQENEYLRNKINTLEKLVKWHEENECELNTKLCRYKGIVDNIDSYKRMLEGRGIE